METNSTAAQEIEPGLLPELFRLSYLFAGERRLAVIKRLGVRIEPLGGLIHGFIFLGFGLIQFLGFWLDPARDDPIWARGDF
jgi:hypothetical protein